MAQFSCAHYFRLYFCCFNVVAALFCVFAFYFKYDNFEAATWAFISALIASVCLKLHILYQCNALPQWHSPQTLDDIALLGVIACIIGFAAGIWYIFVGLYHKRGVMPLEDCPYLSAVWAVMTSKGGVMLYFNSKMYSRMVSSNYRPSPPFLDSY